MATFFEAITSELVRGTQEILASDYDFIANAQPGVLARAGATYANEAALELHGDARSKNPPMLWPWRGIPYDAKPVRESLVLAASLIFAEIYLIDKTAETEAKEEPNEHA